MKWSFLKILVFLNMILFIIVFFTKIIYNVLPLFINKFGHTFFIDNSVIKLVKYEYVIQYDNRSYTDVNLKILEYYDKEKTFLVNFEDTKITINESFEDDGKNTFYFRENQRVINNDNNDNEELGYIIVNQKYWERIMKMTSEEALKNLNMNLGLNLCFIYDSMDVAREGMRLIFRLENLYSKDMWYFFLYLMFLIMILTIFISIIRNFIFELFPSINKNDTIFFNLTYNYIFHIYLIAIIIALPGVSMISNNITFDKCLGFNVLSRYSIVLNRKFVNKTTYQNIALQMEKDIFDIQSNSISNNSNISMLKDSEEKRRHRNFLKSLFYFNDWDDDSRNYLNLIVFFCFFIWITKSFRFYKYKDPPGRIFIAFSIVGFLFSLYLTAIPVLNQTIIIFNLIGYNPSNLGFFYNWGFLTLTILIIIIETTVLIISIKNYFDNKKKKELTRINYKEAFSVDLTSN